MSPDEQKRLALRARDGDRLAFRQLVEGSYMQVYRLCYKYSGHREDAEDVCQEIFARLGSAILSYKGDAAFSTWLYRVSMNTLSDHFRRRKAKREMAFAEGFDRESEDEHADDRLFRQQILNEVLALPEKLKNAAILVYAEGLSHAEAAEALGCSEGTISWRVHEARKKLLHLKDKMALMLLSWIG